MRTAAGGGSDDPAQPQKAEEEGEEGEEGEGRKRARDGVRVVGYMS